MAGQAERTFIMVKPDGVQRGLVGEIIKRFENRGYKLIACKMTWASEDHLKLHYADLSSKPFFNGLIKYMASGPVVAMVWEGAEVVRMGRMMLGETDPKKSLPGSIRGDFCIEMGRDRQMARERMRRYRIKTKEQKNSPKQFKASNTVMTRTKREEQRAKWRRYKRTYRSKLTSQKKRRIRERDAAAKRKKKPLIQIKLKKHKNVDDKPFTPAAARQAIFRSRKKLPHEPSKFAAVIKGIVNSATPRKRAELSKDGVILTPSKRKRLDLLEKTVCGLKTTLESLKVSKKDTDRIKRKTVIHNMSKTLKKHKMMLQASKELGIRWKTLIKWSKCTDEDDYMTRKKRSDALPSGDVEVIKDFYLKPYISVIHAGKQSVSKENQQRQTMNMTIKDTHSLFKKENPDLRISFSKFASLKPNNVKPVDKQNFRGCLCEKCVNIELLLKTLNKELTKELQIKDRYEVSKITMCSFDHFPKLDCVRRRCNSCGVENKLDYLLKSLEGKMEKMVTWYKWQTVKVTTKKNGEEVSKKMLVTHSTSLKGLVNDLLVMLKEFSSHLFEAHWQYKQFTTFKDNLPDDVVLCVLDFAENYTTKTQDEVQSAHWAQDQITIHPVVCFYKDITHEMVFISDDVKHDSKFVEKCVSDAIYQLRNVFKVKFSKMVQFTDGCSGQYKSKFPFMDISARTDVKIERHFFGSGHGKGPADSCSGVVKASATRAVKGGEIISNAIQFKNHVASKLTRNNEKFRRSFHFIKSEDVDRSHTVTATTVKGTRKLHCVKGVSHGIIQTRELSCLCNTCFGTQDESGKCKASNYVDEWKLVQMQPEGKKKVQVNGVSQGKTKKAKKNNVAQGKNKLDMADGKKEVQADGVSQRKAKRTNAAHGKNKLNKTKNQPKISLEKKKGNNVKNPKNSSEKTVKMKTLHTSSDESNSGRDEKKINDVKLSVDIDIDQQTCYTNILEDLAASTTFVELKSKCLYYESIKQIPEMHTNQQYNIVDGNFRIDKEAMNILPDDVESFKHSQLFPVKVMGDGNCLPRAGSVLAFGHENNHIEMRARIAIELALYDKYYTDPQFLRKGLSLNDRDAKKIPASYVMYSEAYVPGDVITTSVVERTFQQEVKDICRPGDYMGIWQLFALASVLQRPLMSVYPQLGNPSVRSDLHRVIFPRCDDGEKKEPVHIMWSSARTDEMVICNWVPNHFCPLLPLTLPTPVALEETEFDVNFDMESMDFSSNSEQIEEIVRSLYENDIDSLITDNDELIETKSTLLERNLGHSTVTLETVDSTNAAEPIPEASDAVTVHKESGNITRMAEPVPEVDIVTVPQDTGDNTCMAEPVPEVGDTTGNSTCMAEPVPEVRDEVIVSQETGNNTCMTESVPEVVDIVAVPRETGDSTCMAEPVPEKSVMVTLPRETGDSTCMAEPVPEVSDTVTVPVPQETGDSTCMAEPVPEATDTIKPKNICHGSDAVESAKKEISLWFKDEEITPYESCQKTWVYE